MQNGHKQTWKRELLEKLGNPLLDFLGVEYWRAIYWTLSLPIFSPASSAASKVLSRGDVDILKPLL